MGFRFGFMRRFKIGLVEAVAGSACVLTGGLIILNAVSLQPGPHPAPMFTGTVSVSSGNSKEQSVEAVENPQLLHDVQDALKTAGYLSGVADPDVSQTIREFQSANNMPVTGVASEVLLARILLDNPGNSENDAESVPETDSNVASLTMPADNGSTVRFVQQSLNDLGFGPLSVDGIMGSHTIEAIQSYESDRGMPLTGKLSAELIGSLKFGGGLSVQ